MLKAWAVCFWHTKSLLILWCCDHLNESLLKTFTSNKPSLNKARCWGDTKVFCVRLCFKKPVNIIVPGVKWPGVSKNAGPPEQRSDEKAAIMDKLWRRQDLPDGRTDLRLRIWGFCEWGSGSEIMEGIWGDEGSQWKQKRRGEICRLLPQSWILGMLGI